MRLMTPWHVPTKSSSRPKSVRSVMNRRRCRELNRFDEPVEIVASRLGDDREPELARPRRTSPGRSRRSGRSTGRAPQGSARPRRTRARRDRRPGTAPAARRPSGRAATTSASSSRASTSRASSAPAKRTRPAGLGSSSSSPSCVDVGRRDRGSTPCVPQRLRRSGPDRPPRRGSGPSSRAKSARRRSGS